MTDQSTLTTFAAAVASVRELDTEFDRRFAAWMEAERALEQAHLDFIRDIRADLSAIIGETCRD